MLYKHPIQAGPWLDWRDIHSKTYLGLDNVRLNSFTAPSGSTAILAGSTVEINGSLYEYATNTTVTGYSSALNEVWIKLTPDPVFTEVRPTWDEEKQGLYDGTDKYLPYYWKKQMNTSATRQSFTLTTIPLAVITGSGWDSSNGNLLVGWSDYQLSPSQQKVSIFNGLSNSLIRTITIGTGSNEGLAYGMFTLPDGDLVVTYRTAANEFNINVRRFVGISATQRAGYNFALPSGPTNRLHAGSTYVDGALFCHVQNSGYDSGILYKWTGVFDSNPIALAGTTSLNYVGGLRGLSSDAQYIYALFHSNSLYYGVEIRNKDTLAYVDTQYFGATTQGSSGWGNATIGDGNGIWAGQNSGATQKSVVDYWPGTNTRFRILNPEGTFKEVG